MTPILASIAGIALVFVLLRMVYPDMFSGDSIFDLFGDSSDSSDGGDGGSSD